MQKCQNVLQLGVCDLAGTDTKALYETPFFASSLLSFTGGLKYCFIVVQVWRLLGEISGCYSRMLLHAAVVLFWWFFCFFPVLVIQKWQKLTVKLSTASAGNISSFVNWRGGLAYCFYQSIRNTFAKMENTLQCTTSCNRQLIKGNCQCRWEPIITRIFRERILMKPLEKWRFIVID